MADEQHTDDEVPISIDLDMAAVVEAYKAAMSVLEGKEEISVLALAGYIVIMQADRAQSEIGLTLDALGILTYSMDKADQKAYEAYLQSEGEADDNA